MQEKHNSFEHLGHCIDEFLKHNSGGIKLSQVQFSATFEVTGGGSGSPLIVTPPSQDFQLVVGTPVDGDLAAQVSGGVAPYSYSLDPESGALPTGVSLDGDPNTGEITLAGTPTVSGNSSSPVLLNIVDSTGASAQAKVRIGSQQAQQQATLAQRRR